MSLHYVPAGVELYCSQANQLAVSNSPSEDGKEHTLFGKKVKRWQTKDKKVALTNYTTLGGANLVEQFQAVIPLFNASFVNACGLTKVLANPVHKPYVKTSFENYGIESIIDSGGFQLLKSVVDFVDPNDVIKNYNQCANIGMPLDLPVRSALEPYYFDPVSKLIKANDDYMLERLDKGIDLALISHGTNLELRKRRLDVLDREAKVVAIAGLNITPPANIDPILSKVESLMYVLTRYRKTTRYFHVLGVTSKFWIFVYALIDQLKYVQQIGADSVSHRLNALAGIYETSDFRVIQIDKSFPQKTPLNCACPICHSLNDLRFMNNSVILECHTLWVKAQQTVKIQELASAYLKGNVTLKQIQDHLGLGKTPIHKIQYVTDYIREIVASGKFRPVKPPKTNKSLFHEVNKRQEAPDTEQSRHVQKVIKRYEKFHKVRFL